MYISIHLTSIATDAGHPGHPRNWLSAIPNPTVRDSIAKGSSAGTSCFDGQVVVNFSIHGRLALAILFTSIRGFMQNLLVSPPPFFLRINKNHLVARSSSVCVLESHSVYFAMSSRGTKRKITLISAANLIILQLNVLSSPVGNRSLPSLFVAEADTGHCGHPTTALKRRRWSPSFVKPSNQTSLYCNQQ